MSRLTLWSVWSIALLLTLCLGTSVLSPRRTVGTSTIYITTIDDVNIEDLFRNMLIPDFQRAYPQYRIDYTNLLHGIGSQQLLTKVQAAVQAGKKQLDLDIYEDTPVNYPFPAGKSYRDFFLPLDPSRIPNAARIDPAVEGLGRGYAVAYRASAVTLAYNSQEIPNPPRTFTALIAWIRAHPGRFTYCSPAFGGTGGSFVASALRSVMDESLLHRPYAKASEQRWPKAWSLLKSIEPDMFQQGFHPIGNVPILNLLSRGTIWMSTAWSDQGLQAQAKGILPSYIHFTQIAPPFAGGPAWLSIPRLAQNPQGARDFIDFVLRPDEQARLALRSDGFPTIRLSYLPQSVARHFGAMGTAYGYWPGGAWDVDLVEGWRINVPNSQ